MHDNAEAAERFRADLSRPKARRGSARLPQGPLVQHPADDVERDLGGEDRRRAGVVVVGRDLDHAAVRKYKAAAPLIRAFIAELKGQARTSAKVAIERKREAATV